MVARKHIIHPTLYAVDAVLADFIPFWLLTFITGGLLVASAMAYRQELQNVYGRVRGWLSSRPPERNEEDEVAPLRRISPALLVLTVVVVLSLSIVLAPAFTMLLSAAVATSTALWAWVLDGVPFVEAFERSYQGWSGGDG